MQFRKATETDIGNILKIIEQAQAYLREHGINQWQNNYPNAETIRQDIADGCSYVLLEGNYIAATAAISFAGEKTYASIYEGQWVTNRNYAVIHRIAVDNGQKGRGVASEMIKQAEQLCLESDIYSIKVDTHEKNLSMQRLLQKNSFHYCGIIYLEDGGKRIAFEKLLEE